MSNLALVFHKVAETKNTHRFAEETSPGAVPAIGSLYVQKVALEKLGFPDALVVTISVDD